MLVPMRCILETTERYDYAAGAFNVNAVCQAEAAVRIHEIFHSPAILQGADLANGFMGGRNGKKPFTKLHGGCIDQTGQGDRSGDTQKQGVFTLIQFCPKVIAGSGA